MAIHAAGTAMGSPMTHLSNIMSYTQLYSCILFDQKWKPESRLFGCCKIISYNMYSRALSHPVLNWWSNSLALACFWDGTCSHTSWVVLFFFCLVAVSAGSCSLLKHEAVARGCSPGLPCQGGTCKMPVMGLNASLADKGGRRAKRAVGTSPQVWWRLLEAAPAADQYQEWWIHAYLFLFN